MVTCLTATWAISAWNRHRVRRVGLSGGVPGDRQSYRWHDQSRETRAVTRCPRRGCLHGYWCRPAGSDFHCTAIVRYQTGAARNFARMCSKALQPLRPQESGAVHGGLRRLQRGCEDHMLHIMHPQGRTLRAEANRADYPRTRRAARYRLRSDRAFLSYPVRRDGSCSRCREPA